MIRDIYTDTRQAFIEGRLHSTTATGQLARDRDFIAECDLAHGPGHVALCAHHVVRGPWTLAMLAHLHAT